MSYKIIIDSCGELTEEMKNARSHHARLRNVIWKNITVRQSTYMQ